MKKEKIDIKFCGFILFVNIAVFLLLLIVMISCGGICNKENACSSDDNSSEVHGAVDTTEEEQKENVEIVINNGENLPACETANNNSTAYRESSKKFFICKQGAWEQFTPEGMVKTEEEEDPVGATLNSIWENSKVTFPEENHLLYVCSAILEIRNSHSCLKETE